MKIRGLHHVALIVADLPRARDFYEGVLGLFPDPTRPRMEFDGVWYSLGSQQQVHLMCLPDPDAGRSAPEHGGRDRHVALAVDRVDALGERLLAAGIPFSLSRSGRRALFCRDPDGNALEFTEART